MKQFNNEAELLDFLALYNMSDNPATQYLTLQNSFLGATHFDIDLVFVSQNNKMLILKSLQIDVEEKDKTVLVENDLFELLHEKELLYFPNLGDFGFYNPNGGFGGLTEAPVFISYLEMSDDDKNPTFEVTEKSEGFYYTDYCVNDFVEVLNQDFIVIFQKIS
jgi:hypothetical protein